MPNVKGLLMKNVLQVKGGTHHVDSGLVIATGRAEVYASGDATVLLFDMATCVASGNANVTARGDGSVHASENVEVDAGGKTFLEAYGDVHFTLRGDARGMASGNANGFVLERASITTMGEGTLTMMSTGELTITEFSSGRINYTTNRQIGGAKGKCLVLSRTFLERLSKRLDKLQAKKNDGRGVSCVRAIVSELSRGDVCGALAVTSNESDKIRGYKDIVRVLRKVGFWYDFALPNEFEA